MKRSYQPPVRTCRGSLSEGRRVEGPGAADHHLTALSPPALSQQPDLVTCDSVNSLPHWCSHPSSIPWGSGSTSHLLKLLSLVNIWANKMSLGFNKSPCQPDGIKNKSLILNLGSVLINSTEVMIQILAGKAFWLLFKAGGAAKARGKGEMGQEAGDRRRLSLL